MKIFEDKYPLGSLKNQKSAGLYYDDMLYQNLKILAEAMMKDNSFLILVSSQALSVRTGKSTFVQHTAEAWNHILLNEYGIKRELTMANIAFNAEEFEKKAFALHEKGDKNGVIILDESDDLTGHSLSQEVKSIKRFLRKAGQLNLLMIMILPDFFEFPKSIAVNRSVALITVDYGDRFERGHWKFYDFQKKKSLYIIGKKFNDYSVVAPTLRGGFSGNYLVNEEEYRKEKFRDLKEDSEKQKERNLNSIKKSIMTKIFCDTYKRFKGKITMKELSECFGISDRTATDWVNSVNRITRGEDRTKYNIKDYNNDDLLENKEDFEENRLTE